MFFPVSITSVAASFHCPFIFLPLWGALADHLKLAGTCAPACHSLWRVRGPVLSLSSIKGSAFLRQSWCKEALPRQPSSFWVQSIQWEQTQAVTWHTVWVGVPPSFRLTVPACDQSMDHTYLSKKVGLNLLHKNHWWKVKVYTRKAWKMLF